MDSAEEKDIEKWIESLKSLSFEDRATAIKDQVVKHWQYDYKSKRFFEDCFNYFMKQYKINKPVEMDLLKIYLVNLCGWKEEDLTIEGFLRTLVILELCGFETEYK